MSWAYCNLHWQARRLQFALKTLLLLVAAAAIVCGWVSSRLHKATEQRQAIAQVESHGGQIIYDLNSYVSTPGAGLQPCRASWLASLRPMTSDEVLAILVALLLLERNRKAVPMSRQTTIAKAFSFSWIRFPFGSPQVASDLVDWLNDLFGTRISEQDFEQGG